jgi:hypothetical protein
MMIEVIKVSMVAKTKEKKLTPMIIDDDITMPKSQSPLEHKTAVLLSDGWNGCWN